MSSSHDANNNEQTSTARRNSSLLLSFAKYHPIVIEGMGVNDPRDPSQAASQITRQLQAHFNVHPVEKPPLVIIQGDPLRDKGISAITPLVAKQLGAPRGLVCLDADIFPNHTKDADRDNVILEFWYSDLTKVLEDQTKGIVSRIESSVDRMLEEKNQRRSKMGKPPLQSYYRDFALLQEVTKAACRQVCGGITVIHTHTISNISDFSVTSFYTVGLELGLVQEEEIVPFENDEACVVQQQQQ